MNRRQRTRALAAGGVITLSVQLALAASASADPHAHVRVLSRTSTQARLLLSVTGVGSALAVQPSKVVVRIDGRPAAATTEATSPSPSSTMLRRAVLVFDSSGSMAGAGIAGARAAALAFINAVPADVQVALVAFSDKPRLLVAPTTSRPRVRAAISGLSAGGETALYDGVDLGVRVAGTAGERALIVLSDGADTRSRLTATSVTRDLRRSGVRMDAVAFNTADAVRQVLTHMTAVTGGEVTAVGRAPQLAAAFATSAKSFALELVVDVALPTSAAGRTVAADVSVPAGATVLTAHTTVDVPAGLSTSSVNTSAQAKSSAAAGRGAPTRIPLTPLMLVFAGLAGLCYVALLGVDNRWSSGARTRRLLARNTFRSTSVALETEDAGGVARGGVAGKALALAERVVDRPGRKEKLTLRLARADVSLKPNEWLVAQAVVVLVATVIATLLFRALGLGLLFGGVAYFCTGGWLAVKSRRRLRAFDEQLPNSLQLVAGSLSAGFSLAQALDGVVREGLEPISEELNRALNETRLGVPLEDALDSIAMRMDSEDFRWVVMAIRIQREVGGNLAEVLLNTAMMMRERARLRRQVKALSAEGRLSAYVLVAIPILMTLYLVSFRRAYIRVLYTDPLGIGFMISAIVLMCIGGVWMRKIVTVEV